MTTAETFVFVYLLGGSAVSGIVLLVVTGWAVRELWREYKIRRSVKRFLDSPAARASIAENLRRMRSRVDRIDAQNRKWEGGR